jgi:hypothetical protein
MPKEPILFNRLESANSKSVIGVDAVEVGASVTYPSVKYGNGIYSASAGEGAKFESFSAGTAFTVDGWAEVTRHSRPQPFIGSAGATDPFCPFIYLLHAGHIATNRFQVSVYPFVSSRYSRYTFDYAFTDGVPFHVNMQVDNNGGALATDKIKVKINGTLMTSLGIQETATAADWSNMISFHNISVGYTGFVPSWYGEAFDNLKVFDYIMDDTDLRHNERGGMNDDSFII